MSIFVMVVILSEAKDRSRHASKARGSHVSPTRSFASLRMTPGSIGVSLHTTISKPTGAPPDAGRGKLRLPYWGSKVMTPPSAAFRERHDSDDHSSHPASGRPHPSGQVRADHQATLHRRPGDPGRYAGDAA